MYRVPEKVLQSSYYSGLAVVCVCEGGGTLGNSSQPPLSSIQIGSFPRTHKINDACSAKGSGRVRPYLLLARACY